MSIEQNGAGKNAGGGLGNSVYVQFGCGLCAPATWRNFDAGPAFWIQRNLPVLKAALLKRGFPDYPRNIEYGDVIKGLPVAQLSGALTPLPVIAPPVRAPAPAAPPKAAVLAAPSRPAPPGRRR